MLFLFCFVLAYKLWISYSRSTKQKLKKIKNFIFLLLCSRLFVTLSTNIKVRIACFAVFIEKIDKLHKKGRQIT